MQTCKNQTEKTKQNSKTSQCTYCVASGHLIFYLKRNEKLFDFRFFILFKKEKNENFAGFILVLFMRKKKRK